MQIVGLDALSALLKKLDETGIGGAPSYEVKRGPVALFGLRPIRRRPSYFVLFGQALKANGEESKKLFESLPADIALSVERYDKVVGPAAPKEVGAFYERSILLNAPRAFRTKPKRVEPPVPQKVEVDLGVARSRKRKERDEEEREKEFLKKRRLEERETARKAGLIIEKGVDISSSSDELEVTTGTDVGSGTDSTSEEEGSESASDSYTETDESESD